MVVYRVRIVVLSNVFIPAIASSNSGGESETIKIYAINAVDPLFFLVVFFMSSPLLPWAAMAGIMATGRLSTGMKHAGMMMIICLVLFNIAAFSPSLIMFLNRWIEPHIGAHSDYRRMTNCLDVTERMNLLRFTS